MRCPNCGLANEEGVAYCANCAAPLTAYGGQLTGEVSARSRAQAARLAVRPPAVMAMTAVDVLIALLGPLRAALAKVTSQPRLNQDATNYIGTAVGAVNTTLTVAILLPIGIALLVLGWATWSQKPWAWTANAALLGLGGLVALLRFGASPGLSLLALILVGVAGYFWLKPEPREWFGME